MNLIQRYRRIESGFSRSLPGWRRGPVLALAGLLFLAAISAPSALAADTPALTGVAVDASGGVLPGVTVMLTPVSRDAAEPQVQITDGFGNFSFDDVQPGTYAVVFSLDGFAEKRLTSVVVPAREAIKVVLELSGIAEVVEVHATQDTVLPEAPTGETQIEEKVLATVPLAKERFDDALPLLPGVIRGPDGLLNMSGARADQSALLVNGVNMTDPVTGHFAVRLPLEAVESLNVNTGVYSAAYGSATGGVTNVVLRSGSDRRDFQLQNIFPRFRFKDGGLRGFDAFTPRLRVSGPIRPGRLWFSQALNYRFVRSRVDELQPLDLSEQKVESFDSVSQIDYAVRPTHRLTATLVWFPSNIDNAGIDTLHPYDATPDIAQRGWNAAVSERAILRDNMTLATAFGVKQFDMSVLPKHDAASLITVDGSQQNYFNRFDRDSRRYDVNSTLTAAIGDRWGDHLISLGGQFARTSFEGTDTGLPVLVTRANGTPLRRIDFVGNPAVGASNTEVAAFVDDHWSVDSHLTFHAGMRYSHEGIAAEHTLAPRFDVSFRPFSHDRTVIKVGVGSFYDKLPLNAEDFERHQRRLITEFDDNGNVVDAPMFLDNRVSAGGLYTPYNTAWNVELDQRLAPDLSARVGFRQARGAHELVVDPISDQGALVLSRRGRTRSHEFEATLRRRFRSASQVTFSYVRASTKGNLNDFVSLFGDFRDPIIHPDEFSRQPFDVPNRFLVWGVVNLPQAITVAPTVEHRDGFPYTVVDEQQHVVGSRNRGGRYPDLFTLDVAVTKDVHLTRKQRARVGLQVFNLTGHFNPRDIQNNVSSANYGLYANSADRQVRAKFVLLF